MNRTRKYEIIVGFFVLVALAALLTMTFVIRGSTGLNPYIIRAQFRDVAGLEMGSPVLVSGFRLGRVVDMEPTRTDDNQPAVIITTKVARDVPIYKDATVELAQQGFIGDKRLEIDPGTPEAGEIPEGYILESNQPADMKAVFSQMEEVAVEMKATITEFRELMTDEERIASIDETLRNVNQTTERFLSMMEENRQTVRETVVNLNEISEKSIEVANRADRLVEKTENKVDSLGGIAEETLVDLRDNSRQLSARIDRLLDKTEEVETNANELLVTSRQEVETVSRRLQKTSDNINELITAINKGEGTTGRLINDPTLINDLEESIGILRNTLLNQESQIYNRRLPYRNDDSAKAATPSGSAPPSTAEANGSPPSDE